jgi:ABC-type glycerol-3-phosphate transport system substrate-binding protein
VVRRIQPAAVAAIATALLAAACGGSGNDEGATGSGSAPQAVKDARQIDLASMQGAKGRVTYCTGKDTTGETKEWSKRFNAKYKAQGLSVRILEFPASADAQRQQFL